MLIVALVKAHKLSALREAFEQTDRNIFAANSFLLQGDWVVRIVFQCDELPPPEFEIPIEHIYREPTYCHVCGKKLQVNNRSGYCYRHLDESPRRRSPRNKK